MSKGRTIWQAANIEAADLLLATEIVALHQKTGDGHASSRNQPNPKQDSDAFGHDVWSGN